MRSLLNRTKLRTPPLKAHSLILPTTTMATSYSSSLLLPPSVSLNKSRNASSLGFSVNRSRASMSVSAGSQTTLNDSLFADYKPTSAFLFPGQGAQAIGMGKEAQSVAAAADLYTKANHILGYDLLDICVNGPKEKLDSTVISQPAIYVTSLAAVELLRVREGGEQIINSVDVTCGLSLGEYTALAFAGAFRYDLLDICVNGPKEKLDSTVISQPAIYVTSLAAVELLRVREGGEQIINSVDVTCGLSLGEYTALAFAGAFSFEDGLKLVKLRGEAMQAAADAAKSAMVSIIGLDSEKVQQLCDAANQEVEEADKVQIANYLCPGNYAVSGGLKGIEAVEAKAKSFKARMTVRLAVAGAFHTSFMEPAVSRLEAALASTEIRSPRIPVISNVDAQPHADPDTIKKILARQVTSPVQWETTVKTLLSKGLKSSYELGPGKVIAGIFKRVDKTASVENISA
ncbi:hypothetical protein DY000_02030108 [Brassica cretica]|uniref:Malonyl-CoA:ACP transacylase (MAT) domain-containing protein n=1 Tax=Brassica cretica TaxID=69181 RepID=A0ABQ7DY41_BRACR|nr:hypothetical protein DY000_02030108 [Brassica cretica]